MDGELKPEYIDVPAHRVLKLTVTQLQNDFEFLLEDGTRQSFENHILLSSVIILRKKDDKQFREPRWHRLQEDFGRIFYLEEI